MELVWTRLGCRGQVQVDWRCFEFRRACQWGLGEALADARREYAVNVEWGRSLVPLDILRR